MKLVHKYQKLSRLYHTIKYLKAKQFIYRAYYGIRSPIRKLLKHEYPVVLAPVSSLLTLTPIKPFEILNVYENKTFTFIGLSYEYSDDTIDWNYDKFGKLWNYNLTYFDFINQEKMDKELGLNLIQNFIRYPHPIRGKRMPFPISLRNLNLIKFITREKVRKEEIDTFIFNQYLVLLDNLEYHILGNHLLENGFSLLFGAYYFKDDRFYIKAKEILEQELEEQILEDGAHFELSPMYHQVMLFRVLDCINLVQNSSWKHRELLGLLVQKAEMMLGWLEIMTYKNGDIPLLNDSARGIAPSSEELFYYAQRLNLSTKKQTLSQSGYRKHGTEAYECVVDVGNIGPDYIPGHAHSDTFNFELYVKNQPVIVDTGISTYENNAQRTLERSTCSHNTVEIEGENQSQVWGGFRVAQRAKVIDLVETEETLKATHDGYKHLGCFHTREWHFLDKTIKVVDTISGKIPNRAIAYLHFHPSIKLEIINNTLLTSFLEIHFQNIENLSLSSYNYSNIFNQKITSNVLKIEFNKIFSMEIKI